MGGGDYVEHQNLVSLVPEIALCAIDRIEKLKLKIKDTPGGGNLLGILQPVWYKAIESDMRLEWIEEMLRRGIVVREIHNKSVKSREFKGGGVGQRSPNRTYESKTQR